MKCLPFRRSFRNALVQRVLPYIVPSLCVSLSISTVATNVQAFDSVSNRGGAAATTGNWKSQKLSSHFYAEGGDIGDFDGDGFKDIVAGPLLYFGPKFEEAVPLEEVGPHSINGYSQHFFSFAFDVDQDGHVDIVTVGFPGEAGFWHRNPGSEKAREGRWEKFQTLSSIDNESPMFLDIDGDSRPELICCHGGNFGYAKIPEQPTAPWQFYPVSKDGKYQRFTHGIGVGDVNDDGLVDILSKDGWWKRPAKDEGQPWEFVPFQFSGPGGAQMFAVDLDGDGKTEVVTSIAAHGHGLAVYKKKDQAGTTWDRIDVMTDTEATSPTGLAISQLHAVDLVDIDGDGKLDILTGKRFWAHNGNDVGENEPVYLVWFKVIVSNSGMRFVPHIVDSDSGVGTQISTGDIDGDGRLDVLSVSKRGIHVLTQTSESESDGSTSSEVAEYQVAINDSIGGFRPGRSQAEALNLDFETGNLKDWTATGAAFFNQPVRGDVIHQRRQDSKSNHQGEYWVGTYEVTGDIGLGTLTSDRFKLTLPWISYLQGGGQSAASRFELIDADTNEPLITSSAFNSEDMKYHVHHLPNAIGKTVFIRLVDEGKGGWGHINFDDFRLHADKPNIPANLLVLPRDVITHRSLPPDQVAQAMTLPEGFKAQVMAAEPDVRQPIAMTIDARGRVWVAEAYQYPIRAEGDVGKDRVLIFEDTDGDGTLDKKTVFIDQLNLVSGIEVGMGGLWVGAAPYLLFVPDQNMDDVPDGPPVKKLTGWGYQDTHETLNSFIWGPDGWLYGCHGVFTHSDVRVVREDGAVDESKPGVKINAGIWRYRPQTETFEVFAHGTSNPWGLDFNDTGDAFLTACVIPHLFHVIPQARYHRQAGNHFNRFTYSDIHTVAKHRHWSGENPHAGNNRSDSDGGGHAHSGAMFYLGGSWPERYRNQLLMNNIHGARLNQDQISPSGSGYVGDRAPDFLLANDQSSQILYFRTGPDGQMIAIDWYDAQQCHINDPAQHDQSNGRIYRISYGDAPTVQVDLHKCTDVELVDYQSHPNDWYVRTARRILMERAVQAKHANSPWISDEAIGKVHALTGHEEPRLRLRGLWLLAACQQIDTAILDKALADPNANVRGWGVRFISDRDQVISNTNTVDGLWQSYGDRLSALAKNDPSPVVRLELASLSQKIANEIHANAVAKRIVLALISHAEDAGDHNLPLMYWYAASKLIETDPKVAQEIQAESRIPLISQYAIKQLTQMWMEQPPQSEAFLGWLDRCLDSNDGASICSQLDSVLDALAAVRSIAPPADWTKTATKLINHDDVNVKQRGVLLATKLSDEEAMASLMLLAKDESSPVAERVAAISILQQTKAAGIVDVAMDLLDQPKLRQAAISAVADNLDDGRANILLEKAQSWNSDEDVRQAWFALLRRPTTAKLLLTRLASNQTQGRKLTADMVQQIVQLDSDEVQTLLKDVWGEARTLDEDKVKSYERIKSVVEKDGPEPDLIQGKAIFSKICGQCHVLFNEGGKIGPELTGSNRRNLDYLLENIVDPSAVMAKEYQPWIIRTKDDQVITGLLLNSDASSLRIQTATEIVVVYNDEIDEKKQSQTSMMPSDLLAPLSDQEIRSLFKYLRSERQD